MTHEIWLVHHTHVDIGYTEPQEIVLRKQAEFIAQVLDHCTATDGLPDGERFCWTCEVSWTVKAFLARYPERAAEFYRRVREGRVEVTALYLNLTDLFTQELLEDTTDYAIELGRVNGFEVVTAMNSDVNGWAWGLPDLLVKRGVRYMDTAINETRSLGVRPRPAMFQWVGPQGGSVRLWHSDGYMAGNYCDPAEYAQKHSHEVMAVRIQGAKHDNAPPGLWLCEHVKNWNATHPAGPKLRLVTSRQWFEHGMRPVKEFRAAWPDWWADGSGSALPEVALVREAQANLLTLRALSNVSVERAREAAAFFCEHTWGAWCSTDEPDSLTSKAQWNTKAGFAYTAAVESRQLLRDALAGVGGGDVVVFNPLGHTRSDVVEVLLVDGDGMVLEPVRMEAGTVFHLVDVETGQAVGVSRRPAIADSARRPAQVVRFMARDVPGYGFRRYRKVLGEGPVFLQRRPEFELPEVIVETLAGGREKLAGWGGNHRDAVFERKHLPVDVDVAGYDGFVELRYRMKAAVGDALYVVFKGGSPATVYLDVPGGVMRPGLDQVPGTATDWHSVQHYFAVEAGGRTTVVATPDIPLVQVNGINTGKWQETLPPHNGVVASWVYNNYWFTNFPAAQSGRLEWRYRVMSWDGPFDRQRAERFAREMRQPLCAA